MRHSFVDLLKEINHFLIFLLFVLQHLVLFQYMCMCFYLVKGMFPEFTMVAFLLFLTVNSLYLGS